MSSRSEYVIKDGMLKKYTGNESEIVIPEGVTTIGKNCFSENSMITSVAIPDSVTCIDYYAFNNCVGLKTVNIPKSVTNIGNKAFYNCKSLQEVYLEDITSWCSVYFPFPESSPLYYTENLYINGVKTTDIMIPDGVTRIERNAFYNCKCISSITIPSSVSFIGRDAFGGCNNLNSVYANDLESWCKIDFEEEAANPLEGNGLQGADLYIDQTKVVDLVIPETVTEVNDYTFSYCKSLKSVAIQEGVTKVGYRAFLECPNLSKVVIAGSIQQIGDGAFSGCNKLEEVTLLDGISEIGCEAFAYCWDSFKKIIIPESVNEIEDDSFEGCDKLTVMGKEGSYAEEYAEENGIDFIQI